MDQPYLCTKCEELDCKIHDQLGVHGWTGDDHINRTLTYIKNMDQNLKKPFFFIRKPGNTPHVGVRFICPTDPKKATNGFSLSVAFQLFSTFNMWKNIEERH